MFVAVSGLLIRRICAAQRRAPFNTELNEVFHALLLGGIDRDLFREM
jgi:hypothetical protein